MTRPHELGPHDQLLALSDGRTLGYAEYGTPDGAPLISCHGGLSSRLDTEPADALAIQLGVRLIAPDRPGIGLSTRQPGRTLLDWPTDVGELADQLGLERFAVMGWSLGGDFAAACGYALGNRITRLGLVATGVPEEWEAMKAEINSMDRMLMRLSVRTPIVDRAIFAVMRGVAKRRPKLVARQSKVSGELAEQLPRAMTEGLQNTKGVVDEYRIMNVPWGFEPTEIRVPTHLWQGDADKLVPPAWVTRLADVIPDATLTVVPGAGHFLWYDHWEDILTTLTAPV